jgi:hypothetical protein
LSGADPAGHADEFADVVIGQPRAFDPAGDAALGAQESLAVVFGDDGHRVEAAGHPNAVEKSVFAGVGLADGVWLRCVMGEVVRHAGWCGWWLPGCEGRLPVEEEVSTPFFVTGASSCLCTLFRRLLSPVWLVVPGCRCGRRERVWWRCGRRIWCRQFASGRVGTAGRRRWRRRYSAR